MLKFSFLYLTYRWVETNDTPVLHLENGNENDYGITTSGFPVVGVEVQIWWNSWNNFYKGTVKRWSKKRNSWVIKYDLWKDKVIEDVPVIQWKFV